MSALNLALSGGVRQWVEFDGESPAAWVDTVRVILRRSGWTEVSATPAYVVGTYLGNPINGQLVTIGPKAYTFRTTITDSVPGEVLQGADLAESIANLQAAINGGAGAGVKYSSTTSTHPTCTATAITSTTITITYKWPGPAGTGVSTIYGHLNFGGYVLRAVSPQGLAVDCEVFSDYDLIHFTYHVAGIRLRSSTDPAKTSNYKWVSMKPGRKFRIVANRCDFTIYVPGESSSNGGNVIMAGVGYANLGTVACHDSLVTDAVTECWYAVGDYASFFAHSTPRVAALNYGPIEGANGDAADLAGWDGCYNGDVVLGEGRMICLTGAENVAFRVLTMPDKPPSKSMWAGDIGMELEPIIAWPDDGSSDVKFRCLKYDAWWNTVPEAMDTTHSNEHGYSTVTLTNNYWFGVLRLIVPPLTQYSSLLAHFTH